MKSAFFSYVELWCYFNCWIFLSWNLTKHKIWQKQMFLLVCTNRFVPLPKRSFVPPRFTQQQQDEQKPNWLHCWWRQASVRGSLNRLFKWINSFSSPWQQLHKNRTAVTGDRMLLFFVRNRKIITVVLLLIWWQQFCNEEDGVKIDIRLWK